MSGLDWRTVTPSNDRKFMVKGAVLARAFAPNCHLRFMLEEIRAYDTDGNADRSYRVRDAATVSDVQVREGKESLIVFRCATEAEALTFCATNA